MRLIKILIVTFVLSTAYAISIDARYRYTSKVVQTLPRYPYDANIYPGECVDTFIALKNEGNITLPWLLEQILPLQTKGRDSIHNDPYALKVHEDIVSLSPIQNYNIDMNDTIFIVEKIGKTSKYTMELWNRSAESLLEINGMGRYVYREVMGSRENRYIKNWQKDTLQTYGCCEQLEGMWRSNFSSRSVTRVILQPDSVFIEMFKYYKPWWPEDLK